MAGPRNSDVLSEAADADIEGIVRHSVTRWGLARAEQYVSELHAAFETLVEFPSLGRNADHIRAGYFRFEHDSHTVFYKKTATGIFIVPVLHGRQRPDRHL